MQTVPHFDNIQRHQPEPLFRNTYTVAEVGQCFVEHHDRTALQSGDPLTDDKSLKIGYGLLFEPTCLHRRITIPLHNTSHKKVVNSRVKVLPCIPVVHELFKRGACLLRVGSIRFMEYAFARAFVNHGAEFVNCHNISPFLMVL